MASEPIGAYRRKGVLFCGLFPQTSLTKIEEEFEFRETDVVIATFPKAGTTWTQEIIWQLLNDADLETSRKQFIMHRVPFLEIAVGDQVAVDMVEQIKGPRIIKTHLPIEFLRPSISKAKVIVVARNLKDQIVSLYYHYLAHPPMNFTGSFDDFFKMYNEEKTIFGNPYDWYKNWYKFGKDKNNVLFTTYEQMKEDPQKAISQMAQHIGVEDKDGLIDRVVANTTFQVMKENPGTNLKDQPLFLSNFDFIRKGQVAGWSDTMSDAQAEFLQKKSEEHYSDIPFMRKILDC